MGQNKQSFLIVIFLFLPFPLFAQGSLLSFDFLSDQGGRCFSQSVGQAFKNPALLSEHQNPSFAVLYGSGPVWKSYSENAAQAIVPFKKEQVALAYIQSGTEGYKESKAMLVYSKALHTRWHLGASFYGLSVRLGENYGKYFSPGTSLGVRYKINTQWSFASVMQWSFTQNTETRRSFFIPQLFSQGFHCRINSNSSVYVETEKGMDDYVLLRMGLIYGIHPQVKLLANITYKQFFQSTLGMQAFISNNWNIHLSFRHHPFLGMQSMVGLHYVFIKK